MEFSREEAEGIGKTTGQRIYNVCHCKAAVDEKIIVAEGENPDKAFEEQIKDEARHYAQNACKTVATGFRSYEEAEKSDAYLDPPTETQEESTKIGKTAGQRYAICDCGNTAWIRKFDIEMLEEAANMENPERAEAEIPFAKDAIEQLETNCHIDLTEAKEYLKSYEDFIKSEDWDEARDAARLIMEGITNQFGLCSERERD